MLTKWFPKDDICSRATCGNAVVRVKSKHSKNERASDGGIDTVIHLVKKLPKIDQHMMAARFVGDKTMVYTVLNCLKRQMLFANKTVAQGWYLLFNLWQRRRRSEVEAHQKWVSDWWKDGLRTFQNWFTRRNGDHFIVGKNNFLHNIELSQTPNAIS